MLFNFALFNCLLFAPVVLAVPSALVGASVARRAKYNAEWAGSIVKSDGNFSWVMGDFIVPTPKGLAGSSAVAWVGIDGTTSSCQNTVFLIGVEFIVSFNGQPKYVVWYQLPNNLNSDVLSDIDISAGDLIRLTVIAFSPTLGKVRIDNLSTGGMVEKFQTFDIPICGLSAEWIIQNFHYNRAFTPLANFTRVIFDNAMAGGSGGIFNGSDGDLVDIQQGDVILTSTSASGWSVTVDYSLSVQEA